MLVEKREYAGGGKGICWWGNRDMLVRKEEHASMCKSILYLSSYSLIHITMLIYCKVVKEDREE